MPCGIALSAMFEHSSETAATRDTWASRISTDGCIAATSELCDMRTFSSTSCADANIDLRFSRSVTLCTSCAIEDSSRCTATARAAATDSRAEASDGDTIERDAPTCGDGSACSKRRVRRLTADLVGDMAGVDGDRAALLELSSASSGEVEVVTIDDRYLLSFIICTDFSS